MNYAEKPKAERKKVWIVLDVAFEDKAEAEDYARHIGYPLDRIEEK
jgi:hypothetical protein